MDESMTKPEIIILEEDSDGRGGYIAVDKHKLTMKVSEVFEEGAYPPEFGHLTFLEYINADTEDKLGWKKHRAKLRSEGYDIEVIAIE